MSNYEVAELTWENGHVAMNELGGILTTAPSTSKARWGRTNDTLESIVHQATYHSQDTKLAKTGHHQANKSSNITSSTGKCGEKLGLEEKARGIARKKALSEYSDQSGKNFDNVVQECQEWRTCVSASATLCKDNDTSMMTWPFFESPRGLKNESSYEGSARRDGSEKHEQEQETKSQTVRSCPTRRGRAAAVHNQSERRRRDRINQKMKALQKLVPNANKTDKASMLDEVIVYLKQLQAQVQMMSVSNMPQMMIPLGMQQQQLQMSLLARMGMGVGLGMNTGMLDINSLARAAAPPSLPHPATAATIPLIPPPFVMPQMIPNQGASNTSIPFNDPYYTFLAHPMNTELYNKMAAAAYHNQVNQAAKERSSDSKCNPAEGE